MYIIINCPHCGAIIMANASNRIKICPKCGLKVSIKNAKLLAKTESNRKALEIIQNLKMKNNDSNNIIYKKFKT